MNFRLTPIVQNLIILNVILYIACELVPQISDEYFTLHKTNALGIYEETTYKGEDVFVIPNSNFVIEKRKFLPIQLVTSFFNHSHQGIFHILFNMLVLASLGPLIEMVLGSPRFLKFYLFCGVVASLFLAYLDPSPVSVVGASTAISGVLVAFAMYFPKQKLQFLFIPFGFEARKFVIGIGIFSAAMVLLQVLGVTDGGYISHFGHLAGMVAALIFFYLEKHVSFLKS